MTAPAEFPYGIKIGNVVLDAVLSQHGDPNGRLRIQGTKGNGAELLFEADANFKGPGVVAQILMMTPGRPGIPESQQRLGLSIVRQSSGADGSQGPDVAVLDLDAHEGSPLGTMPLFIITGGVTHPDDSAIPGKIVLQVSGDGTLEAWDERNGKHLRFDIAEILARAK